jgi:AbrB family looped-hinge helix DNA binding protein
MPIPSRNSPLTVEATVTSRGQVALPSELRKRLGLKQGSRIRFSASLRGAPFSWSLSATRSMTCNGCPTNAESREC